MVTTSTETLHLLQAALAAAAEGVVLLDAAGKLVFMNEAARRLAQQVPAPAVPLQSQPAIFHLCYPDGQPMPPAETPLGRALQGETVVEAVALLARPEGGPTWVASSARPVCDEQGYAVGTLVLLRDVGEQVRLAEELRQSREALGDAERRCSVVADGTYDLEMWIGPNGQIHYVSPSCERITGYTRDEFLRRGAGMVQIAHPEDRARAARYLRQALAGAPGNDVEARLIRKDGEIRWISASWQAVRSTTSKFLGIRLSLRDVSERKRVEAERARLLAELEATIAAVADGLIIYGPSGEVLRMNAAAMRMLGYSSADAASPLAERMARLQPRTAAGKPVPAANVPGVRALRGETVVGEVFVLRARDGRTIWTSTSAAPVRSQDGRLLGAVLTFTDITRRHDREEERRSVLRSISHDLRNPLTAIHGYAQLLRRELEGAQSDAVTSRALVAISENTRHMGAMLQELSEAAQVDAGHVHLNLAPIDLPSFVGNLIGRLGNTASAERILVQAPRGLPRVMADPDRLERILTNLLTNALKYSPPESPVAVTMAAQGTEVWTSIADQGQGIAPGEIANLFQQYYRTREGRRQGDGMGLGLYITRGLVAAHGGRIWVESEVGVGSTFTFTLALA